MNQRISVLLRPLSSRKLTAITALLAFSVIGTLLLVTSHAATSLISAEPETGVLSGNAAIVSDGTASGAQAVGFSSLSSSCSSAANTPGGSDGMGGCFPGAFNTGYPHGLDGDTRTPVTLTVYSGSCTIGAGTTVSIDSKNIDCSSGGLFVYGTLNLKNSLVKGEIYENSSSAVLNIVDTEVDGLAQFTYPTIGGANNVTAVRVNAYGGEHTIQCYGNCDVENSWLHDQYEAGSVPHQNGFLSNGGSNFVIRHNSIYCATSGCTADVAFTDDDVTFNATIDKNLFVAAPKASYCIDPSTVLSKNNKMYQMVVTNNVFQRGGNGKCASYGPVYGWDAPNNNPGTSGYGNVWSGNTWDDRVTLASP